MWNDTFTKGLKYVYQLFGDDGYKTEKEVKEQYGLTTMRFNSLKAAIPEDWRVYFTNQSVSTILPIRPHNYDRLVISKGESFSSKVYKYLSDDIIAVHSKYLKWMQDLGTNFCESLVEFGRLHLNIYKVTNVTKYRSFQYRLLQRGLVANIQLQKWGLIPSD